MRAHLIDEDGHRSDEMIFGDFNKLTLIGKYGEENIFDGRKLDYDYWSNEDVTLPGNIIGLRSWDMHNNEHTTEFYEISIAPAEPGVIDIDYDNKVITLTFDEEVIADDLSLLTGNFIITRVTNNMEFTVFSIEQGNTTRSIELNLSSALGKGTYLISYSRPASGGLADSEGNLVEDFDRYLEIN